MNESRLKILVGVLLGAVVVSMLFNFGVFGQDAPSESLCADGSDGTVIGGTSRPAPPDVNTLGLASVTSELPEGQIGAALQWSLDALNIHAESMTAAMVTERFAPSVLEEFSAEDVVSEIQGLARANGAYALVGFVDAPTETSVRAMTRVADREYLVLTVDIAPTEGSGDGTPARITNFTLSRP